jgi:lysozyme
MLQYRISQEERERIISLHENATKSQYLKESEDVGSDATMMKASQQFWDMIKEFEGLANKRKRGVKVPALKAYKDTRGIWTIGYGHTGIHSGTEVSPDMKISEAEAINLLYADAKIAADCVRRMAKEWKNQGVNYTFTQGQFDALVSITFNVGCDGMRTSDFIQELKKGNDKKAGEMIKTFALKGGKDRRKKESEIFLS